ncbi:uncharacterized protein isoform X2 [Choristoneura fumiferana]|uniref:uncharacterized protein isoform X2 n=1 Tax=Choristoneura fumiferana TaxID=7141 RepID=UPI003D15F253
MCCKLLHSGVRSQCFCFESCLHQHSHFFVLLLPCVLCQFEMKPDVRFDETNDRFDVSPLFDAGEYAEKEDFRRSGNLMGQYVPVELVNYETFTTTQNPDARYEKLGRQLFNIMRQISRRSGTRSEGFAWHDDMRSAEQEQNFERNLEQFRSTDYRKKLVDYLHGGQTDEMPSRRSGTDSVKEVLMHHAVPIAMKVKGYLQVPRVL